MGLGGAYRAGGGPWGSLWGWGGPIGLRGVYGATGEAMGVAMGLQGRSEEHTSELQSR